MSLRLSVLIILLVSVSTSQTLSNVNPNTSLVDYIGNPRILYDEYRATATKPPIVVAVQGAGFETNSKACDNGTYFWCALFTQWVNTGYDVHSVLLPGGIQWAQLGSTSIGATTLVLNGALGGPTILQLPALPFTINISDNPENVSVTAVTATAPNVTLSITPTLHSHSGAIIFSPSNDYTVQLQAWYSYLAYLGANAATIHGDVTRLILVGHSSGSWYTGMTALLPKSTYITGNPGICQWCASGGALNWNTIAIVADSFTASCSALYAGGGAIRINAVGRWVGGLPNDGPSGPFTIACDGPSSPQSYVGNALLAPMMVQTSSLDTIVPPASQTAFVTAMATAGTPVSSQVLGTGVWPGHNLDFNSTVCSAFPCAANQLTGGCDAGVTSSCGAYSNMAQYVLQFINGLGRNAKGVVP